MSFKIIMTTSVTRPCFTTQLRTCKTKTQTDFFLSQTGLVLRPTVSRVTSLVTTSVRESATRASSVNVSAVGSAIGGDKTMGRWPAGNGENPAYSSRHGSRELEESSAGVAGSLRLDRTSAASRIIPLGDNNASGTLASGVARPAK